MAGNYRSNNHGIGRAASDMARGVRSTHVRKQTLKKQEEVATAVVTHKESEKRRTANAKGKVAVQVATIRAGAASTRAASTKDREAFKLAQIKQKGAEARRTATHKKKLSSKPKNDLEVGKKKPAKAKRPRLSKEAKW